MKLEHVYLPDSWVLSIESDESRLCFVIDAVLEPGNPMFYSPPRPGEQHAYARLRWCLHGDVYWNDGPNLDQPAKDATGELDYGAIDGWRTEGETHYLEGSWGSVIVRHATEEVEYLKG